MRLLQKHPRKALYYCAIFILTISLAKTVMAEEVEEQHKKTYSLFSSTSLSLLIFPFQDKQEFVDPMHDDIGEKDTILTSTHQNVLFEQALQFNDMYQNFLSVFNKKDVSTISPISEEENEQVKDKKEVNCRNKN